MTTPEQAKDIIRRWNEEGWSGGKYDLAYEIISPNMVVHGAGGQTVGMGPDGLIELIRTWRTAFPDGRMEIDDLIVDGDTVAIRNTWHDTQQGDFYGIPATGKTVSVTSVGIDRVRDGQVVEGWGELDMVGMMQQLGALPMVGPGWVAHGHTPPVWGPTAAAGGNAGDGTADAAVRLVEALFAGDRATASSLVADGFTDHNPVWGTSTLDEALASYDELRAALPDLAAEIDRDNIVREGNQVAVHSLLTGTHSGEALFGADAAGKSATWSHTDFFRFDGDRVVERWVSADTLTLFQQVGVLPAPPG